MTYSIVARDAETVAEDPRFAERLRRLGEAEAIGPPGFDRLLELLPSVEGSRPIP